MTDPLVESLSRFLTERQETLALAESCTGGAISARLVQIPGASRYLLGSIVAYSNGWKESFIGVSPVTLYQDGAVSASTVAEMAMGLFQRSAATYVLAISGTLAPPEGPSTVYLAIGRRDEPLQTYFFEVASERTAAIQEAVEKGLRLLVHQVQTQ